MRQTITNKVAESVYRDSLLQQHFYNKNLFESEYNSKEILTAIRGRWKKSAQDLGDLSKQGLTLSPYLEIGAGYGQCSLELSNKLGSHGYALDLSFHALKAIPILSKKYKVPKMPLMVAADAESLPFKSNSFPFVFTYQTLHHFPTPTLVLKEALRVLSAGGTFFLGDEPVKQSLNVELWRRPTKLRFWEKILKQLLILPFISKIGKNEVDYGIIEGSFSITEWLKALEIFEHAKITIKPYPIGPKSNLVYENGKWSYDLFFNLSKLFIFVTGGSIWGNLRKKGSLTKVQFPKLVCPKCKSSLKYYGKNLRCLSCKEEYFVKDNISVLLSNKLRDKIFKN